LVIIWKFLYLIVCPKMMTLSGFNRNYILRLNRKFYLWNILLQYIIWLDNTTNYYLFKSTNIIWLFLTFMVVVDLSCWQILNIDLENVLVFIRFEVLLKLTFKNEFGPCVVWVLIRMRKRERGQREDKYWEKTSCSPLKRLLHL